MNLQRQSPVALHPINGPPAVPEQCEALNLGKKDQGTNNNNAGENEDESDQRHDQKRIKMERSPQAVVVSRPASPKTSPERFPAPTGSSPVRESATSPERNGEDLCRDSNGTIEMDINVSAGKCNLSVIKILETQFLFFIFLFLNKKLTPPSM